MINHMSSALIKIWGQALAIIAIVSISSPQAFADGPIQPDIPSGAWESHAGGINLAVTLTTTMKKDGPSSVLNVHVKNTSTTVKALAVSSLSDWGFSFYTVNSDGSRNQLHDYRNIHKLPSGQTVDLTSIASARMKKIAPGQTISNDVPISPADLALIKSHSLGWSLRVYDLGTGRPYDIDATPRTLTEAVIAAPASK